MNNPPFTPYPDVNTMLAVLISGAREVLGERLTGMYLDGSLTSGDFDADSDIDFVAVVEDTAEDSLSDARSPVFQALYAMHKRIAEVDSPWAIQLEGSYLSRNAIRRSDPADCSYPNLERGRGERLKLWCHDALYDIHRWILRERGITLFGPSPQTLIDPVSPAQLRQAMQPMLFQWAAGLLADPSTMNSRGYQSYAVLTICRMLYTLENGAVASKPSAARWAQQHLDARWSGLIERAWYGRHHPDLPAEPQDAAATLEFIRFALEQYKTNADAHAPEAQD